jgi:uncharacterized membrane protein YfcA
LAIGAFAGLFGGLLGIGGGSLVVPALVFFLAFNQHKAHGTSLAVVLGMSAASVMTYSHYGHIDWLLAVEIAIGGILGAIIGGHAAARMRSKTLRRVFCVFLMLVGLRMAIGGLIESNVSKGTYVSHYLQNARAQLPLALGTGVLTGFFSSLLGIGGGTIMVPAAALIIGVDQHTAQGVSLAAMMPTALAGTIMHYRLGNVEVRVAKWVALGAVAGALIGACIAGCLRSNVLQLLFGSFLVIMSSLMALKKS